MEAYLAIYDEATGKFLPVPNDLGRIPVTKDDERTFCYMPVHTHKGTHGTLHLAVDPRNDLFFEPVLRALAHKLNRPMSSLTAIYVDGVGMSPFYVRPGMHIKVVFGRK